MQGFYILSLRSIWLTLLFACTSALAQYGAPETLKAELRGDDLKFPTDPSERLELSSLPNSLHLPAAAKGQSTEKFPAVVLFHTCGGVGAHQLWWAEQFLKDNYVVFVIDAMRGLKSDCGSPSQLTNGRLIKDALDASTYLSKLPQVDAKRIALVGFSKGALMANWLASSAVSQAIAPEATRYAAHVSLYGFCGFGPTRGRPQGVQILQPNTDRPLLMLLGGQDTETPPQSCLEMLPELQKRGAPVQSHLYPEATHAWDKAEQNGFTKIAFNGNRVTYRYDAAITQDSKTRVFEFLRSTMKP
jgi:dienelactone hydrolase